METPRQVLPWDGEAGEERDDEMKTSELTGAALDWAVAKCEKDGVKYGAKGYSTDWSQGGPIIEREKITTSWRAGHAWFAFWREGGAYIYGPTPLIAAMRCYVASKLGGEVEIPEELSGDPSEPGHPANPRSQY